MARQRAAAIGAFLEKGIGTNDPDSKGRNLHLYFNASIDLRGDEGSRGGRALAWPKMRPHRVALAAGSDPNNLVLELIQAQ